MNKKNILVSFTILAVTLSLSAQITITNATFPATGDTLRTATDLTPDGIVMTAPGGPQTWDYTSLSATTRQVTVFQPASEGTDAADFPGAELVTISDVGAEVYFDVNASTFSILGISGSGLGGEIPIEADFIYAPPLVEGKAPLNFFDVDQYESNATISLPTSAIPEGILDSLPTGLFDSIRFRITVERLEIVDGYGTLTIPGGTYDVLRQKRTEITTTGVDVHTFLGWVDLSTFIGMDFFLPDTTIAFDFLSNSAKEPIAVVTVDSTGQVAAQVTYKDNGIIEAINPVTGETTSTSISVSPNPVRDDATFELKNMLPGNYTLRIFDTNGQQVVLRKLSADREVISLQHLSAGMYQYNVIGTKGQIMATGKLMKVKE